MLRALCLVFSCLLLLPTVAAAQQPVPLPVLQWGFWGYDGQLTWKSNVPVHVMAPMPPAIGVAGSHYSAAALAADGQVWAWGHNEHGQLGDGTTTSREVPAPVVYLKDVVAIAAGKSHVLALKGDHTVWAWGFNQIGQLGDGSKTDRKVPVQVQGLSGAAIVAIAAGDSHSLAIASDGRLFAWGSQQYGQLGVGGVLPTGNLYLTATEVTSLTNVVAIDACADMSIALLGDGKVWTWGSNRTGALGDGTIGSPESAGRDRDRPSPYWIGLTGAVGVAAGGDAAAALLADGRVATWGSNNHCMLGDGTCASRFTPAVVPGLADVKQIDAGYVHMVALKRDGTVWVWGSNSGAGQLGLGETIYFNAPVPLRVSTVVGVQSVSAGGENVPTVPASVTVFGGPSS